jgi:hypothetical protein
MTNTKTPLNPECTLHSMVRMNSPHSLPAPLELHLPLTLFSLLDLPSLLVPPFLLFLSLNLTSLLALSSLHAQPVPSALSAQFSWPVRFPTCPAFLLCSLHPNGPSTLFVQPLHPANTAPLARSEQSARSNPLLSTTCTLCPPCTACPTCQSCSS